VQLQLRQNKQQQEQQLEPAPYTGLYNQTHQQQQQQQLQPWEPAAAKVKPMLSWRKWTGLMTQQV
jgi:hypothetical protein